MNDLSTPLKTASQRKAERGPIHRVPWGRIGALLLALLVGGVALYLVLVDDPEGGRPSAATQIDTNRNGNPLAEQVSTGIPGAPLTITADPQQFPAGTAPPQPSGSGSGAADRFAAIPDLLEETEFGPIPRMSATGRTPFSAYAHPVPATASGRPMVSIVAVGLGINEAGSLDAIDRLPPAVSLAFAPYGRALGDVVAAARAKGREVLLEIPLEPFDYPENDPGPQTLLTGATPRANLDKLFWLLSRFSGYVGVINNMGARFTASGTDLAPVMEELGMRGLGYLDDGSSNRSLARQIAEGNGVPFSRADLMIDSNPDRAAIRAALDELEARARQTGSAIGIVTALPVSIQTVAEWASALEQRGVALVPVSALMK